MAGGEEQQRAQLAYEASLRSIDQQQKVLEEIRSRTGILLAAASLSASFLGARAFEQEGVGVLSVMALAALVTTLVMGILILVPREEFVFSLSGTVLYNDLGGVDDVAEQHRYVARARRPDPLLEPLDQRYALIMAVKPAPPQPPPPSPGLGRPEIRGGRSG